MSSKTTNGTKRDDNRRRAAHTAAEQKRRNAIRVNETHFSLTMINLDFSFQKGYDALQSLVPNSHLLDPISSQKVSKAAILKRCKLECIKRFPTFVLIFSYGLSCTIKQRNTAIKQPIRNEKN